MAEHDKHFVSCKAAIYSIDGTLILVNRLFSKDYRPFGYGLPGGHIDKGETPDTAMRRELMEELAITVDGLVHTDFFVHERGKIILGYVGRLSPDTPITPSRPEKEVGEWLDKTTFETIDIDAGYRTFALAYWPAAL